jgi:hypothetical protein
MPRSIQTPYYTPPPPPQKPTVAPPRGPGIPVPIIPKVKLPPPYVSPRGF